MAAANADVGVAEAAFFPTVRLNGLAGLQGIDAETLFDWPPACAASNASQPWASSSRRSRRGAYGNTLTAVIVWLYHQIMATGRKLEGQVKTQMVTRAKVIKALAHPTRLFIVDELSRGERCVCELTDKIGADVSTVSKHLSLLKSAGIVCDDKRGAQVFYRLRVPCILNFFGCVEAVIDEASRSGTAAGRAA